MAFESLLSFILYSYCLSEISWNYIWDAMKGSIQSQSSVCTHTQMYINWTSIKIHSFRRRRRRRTPHTNKFNSKLYIWIYNFQWFWKLNNQLRFNGVLVCLRTNTFNSPNTLVSLGFRVILCSSVDSGSEEFWHIVNALRESIGFSLLLVCFCNGNRAIIFLDTFCVSP